MAMMNYGQPMYSQSRYQTPGYKPPAEEVGSNLPGMPDVMSQFNLFMKQFGGAFNPPSAPSAPTMPQGQPGMGSQLLGEIRALMQKMGGGGNMPALTPQMQAEFAQRKASMTDEINRVYNQMAGQTTADLYGAGMENSGRANQQFADLAGRKAQAISALNSALFGEEMGMRSAMQGNTQQSMRDEFGVLQSLLASEEQKELERQRTQAAFAQQDYQNKLALTGSDDARRMQLLQFFISLLPMLQKAGGGFKPQPLVEMGGK